MLKIDNRYLGGGFIYVLFSPLLGEMIQFDKHIVQTGCSTTNQIYEMFMKHLLCDLSVICWRMEELMQIVGWKMGEAFILFSCKQCRGLWYVDVPYVLYDIIYSIYIHNKNAYDKKQQSTLRV